MPKSHTISKGNANDEIRKFLEIKEEFGQQIQTNQLSSPTSSYLNSPVLSFAFYKDQLDSLFNSVEANGFRIYLGADATGKPSLVIYPCTITEGYDNSYSVTNNISTAGDGRQYPFIFTTTYNKTNFDLENE